MLPCKLQKIVTADFGLLESGLLSLATLASLDAAPLWNHLLDSFYVLKKTCFMLLDVASALWTFTKYYLQLCTCIYPVLVALWVVVSLLLQAVHLFRTLSLN
jgi:hypothetical protein